MLCPRCYGKHVVMSGSHVPCPECAGIGEIHCCDGLREQGDQKKPGVETPGYYTVTPSGSKTVSCDPERVTV